MFEEKFESGLIVFLIKKMATNRINNAIVNGNIDVAMKMIVQERSKDSVRNDVDLDYGLNQVLLYLKQGNKEQALASLRAVEDKQRLAMQMLLNRLYGMQAGTLSSLPDLALHMIENNIRPRSRVARALDFGEGDYAPPKESLASCFV